jgi:hypothetical protein
MGNLLIILGEKGARGRFRNGGIIADESQQEPPPMEQEIIA